MVGKGGSGYKRRGGNISFIMIIVLGLSAEIVKPPLKSAIVSQEIGIASLKRDQKFLVRKNFSQGRLETHSDFGDGDGSDGHLVSGRVEGVADDAPVSRQGDVPGRGRLVELLHVAQELGLAQP